jgi:hypothetical protein
MPFPLTSILSPEGRGSNLSTFSPEGRGERGRVRGKFFAYFRVKKTVFYYFCIVTVKNAPIL